MSTPRQRRQPLRVLGPDEAAPSASQRPPWFSNLIFSRNGPRDCVANVVAALEGDPALCDTIRHDEMRAATACRSLPWQAASDWRDWADRDDVGLAEWLQLRSVPVKPATCAAAVQRFAQSHPVNPLQDRLSALVWDRMPRLDIWLKVYLGAEPGGYVRAVGRAWMVGAVARAFRPGFKVDHVLVLEGRQGAGKSTVCAILAMNGAWFADEVADLGRHGEQQVAPFEAPRDRGPHRGDCLRRANGHPVPRCLGPATHAGQEHQPVPRQLASNGGAVGAARQSLDYVLADQRVKPRPQL